MATGAAANSANSAKGSQVNGHDKGVDPVVGSPSPAGAWAKGVPSTGSSSMAPHLQRQPAKNSHPSRNGQNGFRSANGRQPAGDGHGPRDETGSGSPSNAASRQSRFSNANSTRSSAINANNSAQPRGDGAIARGALRRDPPGQPPSKARSARPPYSRQGSGLASARPQYSRQGSGLSAGVASDQVRQKLPSVPFSFSWAELGIHMLSTFRRTSHTTTTKSVLLPSVPECNPSDDSYMGSIFQAGSTVNFEMFNTLMDSTSTSFPPIIIP